jgi:hypothetical protein
MVSLEEAFSEGVAEGLVVGWLQARKKNSRRTRSLASILKAM